MTEERPAHSKRGASGAERWMNCPGSVTLLNTLQLPDSDEPEYRDLGTSAHSAIEKCQRDGLEAWEVVGEQFGRFPCDDTMATAIQVFLDRVTWCVREAGEGAKVFTEFQIDAPDFHPDFYGTLDSGILSGDGKTLWVNDYKHGEGVVVEVEDNPQIMYYAYGLLRRFPEVERVVLAIVQPRAFHPEGAVREWETDAAYIREWAEQTLLPAMVRAGESQDLDAGSWCRFCPAKLVCPLMKSLFGAAMLANPKEAAEMSDEELGRAYGYIAAVKQYMAALENETFRRLNLGRMQGTGVKLVHKKANRVFKGGAEEVFKARFGDDAMKPAAMKSPAELEKLGGDAKLLVKEWAYTPESGLTVALETDKRMGVKPKLMEDVFAHAVGGE